jgi:hypothetical protein
MAEHWPTVHKVFEALSYIVKEADKDGISLYFTISETHEENAKRTSQLLSILDRVQTQENNSTSNIDLRLGKILDDYKNNLDSKMRWYKSETKPLSLYILTDGLWDSGSGGVEPIRNAALKLKDLQMNPHQIGIQFVTFGNDPDGWKRLRQLDDSLDLILM